MSTAQRMPYFHGVSEHLDDAPPPDDGAPDSPAEAQGDGLHHHEMHEDEGGGWHSKHTFPDGREEHADHASYDEAKDHMDDACGQGGDSEGDSEDSGADEGSDYGDDSEPDDLAGSYGRAHKG